MRLLVAMGVAALIVAASPLRPCPMEDSTWCTWYAHYQGNGMGVTSIRLLLD